MDTRKEIDSSPREWLVLALERSEGEALRGDVECTADSQRRPFGSGEELLEILRAVAGEGVGEVALAVPPRATDCGGRRDPSESGREE